jgi:hypothetical protein
MQQTLGKGSSMIGAVKVFVTIGNVARLSSCILNVGRGLSHSIRRFMSFAV